MANFRRKFLSLNIWWKFFPFLLLYIIICISFASNEFIMDESRYVNFARNILEGYYSPPYPNIDLWNGPGYPLVIALFLFLKLPFIAIKILNAVLLYLSLIISYKTISIYTTEKKATLYTILLALYYPVFEMIPYLLTEPLAWFLISLLCFLFCKSFRAKRLNGFLNIGTGFIMAYLVMTKVAFGYVVCFMIIISLLLLLFSKYRTAARRSLIITSLSFIFCLPWLFYNYGLTGRFLYWANSGSMSLYTMSSPYKNELGDWSNETSLSANLNHRVFMDSISKLTPLQRDNAYQKSAIANIKSHPKKFTENWLSNIGRLLFSYPYSKTPQTLKTYYTILPNMFVIVFILISLSLFSIFFKRYPIEIVLLLIFFLVYLAESSLVSAFRRMFYITLPFWLLFISLTFEKTLVIKIKNKQQTIQK